MKRNFESLKDFIAGREFDLAKAIIGLTDGNNPNDPEHHQPCPVCGGNDRFYNREDKGAFNCRQCNFNGDLLALVAAGLGVSLTEAFDIVAKAAGFGVSVGSPVKAKSLFPKTSVTKNRFQAGTVKRTEYIYTDEEGDPRHKVVRFDSIDDVTGKPAKTFSQYKMVNGQWEKGKPDMMYPYRLPDVLSAHTLIVVEGEKVANCLNRVLWTAGNETTFATTSPMGAMNGSLWKNFLKRYSKIKEKRIIIIPDNDESGKKYAHTVAVAFLEANSTANVKIVDLPDLSDGGDFVDWYTEIEKNGVDESTAIETLKALYKNADKVTLKDVAQWQRDEVTINKSTSKNESMGKTNLTRFTDVEDRKVEWFMYNKIPANDISVISGPGAVGKTYVTCLLASHVTNGRPFPDGHPCRQGNVICFPPEGQKSALKRRLEANGADIGKCFILEGATVFDEKTQTEVFSPIILSDCSRLEEAINEAEQLTGFQTVLLIIDPVMSFVGKRNPNRDNEVRQLLVPLQNLADRRRVTIILVAHHGKAEHSSSSNQILSSVAWANVSRAAWQIYRDTQDKDLRYLAPGKYNDCIDPTTISFRIVPQDGRGEGKVQIESMDIAKTADDFMQEQRQGGQRGRPSTELTIAKGWLLAYLADGEKPGTKVYQAAKRAGIKDRTLETAKAELGIVSERVGTGSGSYLVWKLPSKS